jgi:hypothetical protein
VISYISEDVIMANCKPQQQEIERLEKLLAEQVEDCQQIDDPLENRHCLQVMSAIAGDLARAKLALANCKSGLPSPGIHEATGRISFLRVHDAGGYGPRRDQLSGEVVFKLDTHPQRAFGFELREDAKRPAHKAMLDLLRDAMANDFDVKINYRQVLNQANSVAFRIELTKPVRDPRSR